MVDQTGCIRSLVGVTQWTTADFLGAIFSEGEMWMVEKRGREADNSQLMLQDNE